MNDYKRSEAVEKELKIKETNQAKTAEAAHKAEQEVASTHKVTQDKTKAAEEQKVESHSTLDAAAVVKKSLEIQHKNAANAIEREHAEHLLKKIELKQEKETEAI